jgi:WXXGXW repeat (2 copies)
VGPERYGWTPGYWGPRGFTREVIVEAPPVFRVETYGAAPGTGYVWTPGYYAYRSASYVWVVGNWLRPPSVGLGWVEPRYVGVWGHYYFQPGRWDYGPSARGTCYLPDIHARPGEHIRPVVASVAVVSAHVGYVAASARAASHGAVRTASGGYVPGKGSEHGGETHGGAAAHAGGESHGGGAETHAGGETHGGAAETHGGAAETHGGAAGHEGTETHGAATDTHGETHGGTDTHAGTDTHGATDTHGETHGGADLHGPGTEPHAATDTHGSANESHGAIEPHGAGKPEPHHPAPAPEKKPKK